jgi:SAM-dependent MidA family methyltransferase
LSQKGIPLSRPAELESLKGGKPVARSDEHSGEVRKHLLTLIERMGPIPMDRYMETVLYHPRFGYYRRLFPSRSDYITAPQVSSIFSLTIARFVAGASAHIGGEGPLFVVELGAGDGRLAAEATGSPPLAPLISHGRIVWLALDLGYVRSGPLHRGAFQPVAGDGIASMRNLGRALVLGNEFFDALPCKTVVFHEGAFREVFVTAREGRLAESLGPVSSPQLEEHITTAKLPPLEGARFEICLEGREVIHHLSSLVGSGLLVTIDYGDTAEVLLSRALGGGTLRSFGSHSVMSGVLDRPGATDMTADVNFSDLIRWGSLWEWEKICLETQYDFMMAQGLLEEISRMAALAAQGKGLPEYLAAKRFLIPGGIQERYHVLIQAKGLSHLQREAVRRMVAPPRG